MPRAPLAARLLAVRALWPYLSSKAQAIVRRLCVDNASIYDIARETMTLPFRVNVELSRSVGRLERLHKMGVGAAPAASNDKGVGAPPVEAAVAAPAGRKAGAEARAPGVMEPSSAPPPPIEPRARGTGSVMKNGNGWRFMIGCDGRRRTSPTYPTRDLAEAAGTAHLAGLPFPDAPAGAAKRGWPAGKPRRRNNRGIFPPNSDGDACVEVGANYRHDGGKLVPAASWYFPQSCPEPPAAIVHTPPPVVVEELPDISPTPPALERIRAKMSRRTVAPPRQASSGGKTLTGGRGHTISPTRLSREEIEAGKEIETPVDVDRPGSRADCQGAARPCPFVSCSHHLYLDVNPATGSIKLNFPHLEVWEMAETCSLDVADRGGITLEEVGAILNLTRERIRQVEARGLTKIKDRAGDELGLPPERDRR
jgi:hypothetical protein